jgi:hypothetical protein
MCSGSAPFFAGAATFVLAASARVGQIWPATGFFRSAVLGRGIMKLAGIVLFAIVSAVFATSAGAATTDDVKWINQCVSDNKGDAAEAVVLKYCTCMNNKMSNNETQSITQWEKSHPQERAACDKEAGWK